MIKARRYLPEIITILIGILLLVINLIAFSLGHSYTSDEVAIQTMFDEGAVLNGNKWFGISSYIFKLPFIHIGGQLVSGSKLGILIPTILVVSIGFGLFMASFIYFTRQLSLKRPYYILGLWLATLGGSFIFYFFNINSRNIEIGILFASLAAAHYYLKNKVNTNTSMNLLTLALFVVWVFIIASDNFYIFMFGLPIIMFCFWQYFKTKEKKYIHIALFSGISILFGLILMSLLRLIGFINTESSLMFTSYSELISKLTNTPYILIDFVGMNFFGNKAIAPRTIMQLIGVTVIAMGLISIVFTLVRQKKIKDKFTLIYPFTAVFSYCVWLLSDKNFSYYLILLPFLFIFCILLGLKYLWPRFSTSIIVLVTISFLLNMVYISKNLITNYQSYKKQNSINYDLIDTIKSEGYDKGYALFWDSGINTYLSKNKIHFIQTKCVDSKIQIMYWYLSEKDLLIPTNKSFFAYNNSNSEDCKKEFLRNQLGQPSKIIEKGDYTIYFFDRDIIGEMK